MSATEQPLPSPPFLTVPGVPNLRDIGGYPTPLLRPGHVTRAGLVFRAAAPSPSSGPALSALSITDIYDLRSNPETSKKPGPAATPDLHQHHVPVFSDAVYSPDIIAKRYKDYGDERPAEGFARAYTEIIDSGGALAFSSILAHLARPDPQPLLLHCTAGKDRTGVICAIILSLCGVDDDVIAWEYSLTERGLAGTRDELIELVMKYPGCEISREGAMRMLGARPESMLAALGVLRNKYGSVKDYVKTQCGLSDEDIEQLQKNFLVDASTVDKSNLPVVPTPLNLD